MEGDSEDEHLDLSDQLTELASRCADLECDKQKMFVDSEKLIGELVAVVQYQKRSVCR